jgi:GntR family transcriptional regulator, carbon starvation induced regulator
VERYRDLGRVAGKSRAREDEHRPIMEAALVYDDDPATGLLAAPLSDNGRAG